MIVVASTFGKMPQQPDKIIEALYRKNFSSMVLSLARHTGLRELTAAEDAVQEAFAEATVQWKISIPDKPEAWLYRVCRNIALKKIRDRKETQALPEGDASLSISADETRVTSTDDDQLLMLLSCVHPKFSSRSQVIFALRYVAGFRIDQIASILGSPADTITKTLQRTRDLIREQNLVLRPDIHYVKKDDVLTVLKILYLLFSEGSKTSSGKSILNIELCEDAVSLTQSIVRSPVLKCAEAHALFALMLFNLSRFDARFDAEGIPIDLEHQDRSLWNKELISVGVYHLNQSGGQQSSFHLEAAIAYVHATSPSFKETDWHKISLLYERLGGINESPFVKLSHAVAVCYAGQPETALERLIRLGETAWMQSYNLYHAALGKTFSTIGDHQKSKAHYERAIDLSSHEIEKESLRRLLAAL